MLCRYNFSRSHRNNNNENELLVLKKSIVDPLIVFVVGSIFLINILYWIVPFVDLDTHGLLGVLIASGRTSGVSTDAYTLTDFFRILYEQSQFFDTFISDVGLIFFNVLFISTVVLVPLVVACLMCRLWFSPLTVKQRKRTHSIFEIFFAWEYSRVFLFSMFILVWQTERVTQGWVVGLCAPLERIFRDLAYYGLVEPQDAQCYTRIARVGPATYLFLVNVILLTLLTFFVMKASNQYLQESKHFLDYRNKKDGESSSNKNSDDNTKIKPFPEQFTDIFPFIFKVETYCNTRNV